MTKSGTHQLVYVFPAYRKNTDCNVSKHSSNMLLQKGYRLFYIQRKNPTFFLPPTPTDFGEMTVYQLIPYDLLDAMILFPDTIHRDPF